MRIETTDCILEIKCFTELALLLTLQYKRKVHQPKGALYISASSEKKILIMGGTRFIGVFLSRLLVKEGHQVLISLPWPIKLSLHLNFNFPLSLANGYFCRLHCSQGVNLLLPNNCPVNLTKTLLIFLPRYYIIVCERTRMHTQILYIVLGAHRIWARGTWWIWMIN